MYNICALDFLESSIDAEKIIMVTNRARSEVVCPCCHVGQSLVQTEIAQQILDGP